MPLIPYPYVTETTGPPSGVNPAPTARRQMPIEGVDLHLTSPGRVVHRALNDDRFIVDRSEDRWALSVTFGAEPPDQPLGAAHQRWLAKMHQLDIDNHSDIPIGNRANATMTATLTVTAISGNTVTYSVGATPANAVLPAAGQFVRIGARLAMVDEITTSTNQIVLMPLPDSAAVGQTITAGTHFRGRLPEGGEYGAPSRRLLLEERTFQFMEVI